MVRIIRYTKCGKNCSKCGNWKPLTREFWHKNAYNSDGWHNWCKECRLPIERHRHRENFEKITKNHGLPKGYVGGRGFDKKYLGA